MFFFILLNYDLNCTVLANGITQVGLYRDSLARFKQARDGFLRKNLNCRVSSAHNCLISQHIFFLSLFFFTPVFKLLSSQGSRFGPSPIAAYFLRRP